ncbi:MAG TPA: ribosome maturation factor RimM [Gaiellaceae bacterium]|nr:ribosome maturation factor RimM [Gaiellaceae bacterium]
MSERVEVGRVGRPHGLDGSFVVERASADPRWFVVGSQLYAGDAPAAVVASKVAAGRPVVRLDRTVERGTVLAVARAELPATEQGEYYVRDLVGLEVVEETGRRLGKVVGVASGVANDVLELDGGALLPLVEDCVRDIDLPARRILVAPGFTNPV